jgi:hypothetical protein
VSKRPDFIAIVLLIAGTIGFVIFAVLLSQWSGSWGWGCASALIGWMVWFAEVDRMMHR